MVCAFDMIGDDADADAGVDVVHALTKAISLVQAGGHDPIRAHERVKSMYNWEEVTKRTEVVYEDIMKREPISLWTRLHRYVGLWPLS